MCCGTYKISELILLSRRGEKGWGWFAISRHGGTSEKIHETCQNRTKSYLACNVFLGTTQGPGAQNLINIKEK